MIVNDANISNIFSKVRENKKKSNKLVASLSSGKRINKGADDPSGVAIKESFRAQVRGLSMAQRNTEEGISMIQTVDGALSDITDQLMRMEKVSVEAANGTLDDKDRDLLDQEFQSLKESIGGIMENTSFNDIKLLNGAKDFNIQTRDNPYTTYTVKLKSVDLSFIGIDKSSIETRSNASDSIADVKVAVAEISSYRNELGEDYNNLYHAYNDCSNSEINTTAALSKIEDADMAMEAMNLAKGKILEKYNYFMLVNSKTGRESLSQSVNKILFN